MDNDRITSHKLIFHPIRVAEWLNTGEGYPINAEVAISGACNHRCVFCCVDYMKYIPNFLEKELLNIRMREMKELGLKSILLAGNGEPLLNKDVVDIINDTKSLNIDVALSTNGVLFTKDVIEECLESLSWVRFSVSAGTEENYKKIHRGKDGDLARVFNNIKDAADIKRKRGLKTVLNVQIVMTPDNMDEVVLLAKKVKDLGADRFIAKSIGWLPNSESGLRSEIDQKMLYSNQEDIISELNSLNDDKFKCVYRTDRIKRLEDDRGYNDCYASVFHVCIDSNGDVVPCCTFLGVPEMAYGNINIQSFHEIWIGDKRKEVLSRLRKSNLAGCPLDCKLAHMNCYLQELKKPSAHVNFI